MAHFDIMFDSVDLAKIQTRHLIESLVRPRWIDFQGFLGHSWLIRFASRHRSPHINNGMFCWVDAGFGYSLSAIRGDWHTPGALAHCFDNHHAADTAEDFLPKSASEKLTLGGSALAVKVRDYGSLLSSAFMPED